MTALIVISWLFWCFSNFFYSFNLNQLESEELQLDTNKTPEKPSAFIQEVADRKPQVTQTLKSSLKQGLSF